MKRFLLLISLFVCTYLSTAQSFFINGIVVDSLTNKAIPYANIITDNSTTGCISDLNGKFSLKSDDKIKSLIISFVGYRNDTVIISKTQSFIRVALKKAEITLNEIIVTPGINPAHRIIDSVYANRKKNDPFNLESFIYRSYNKFYFTFDIDSSTLNKLDSQAIEVEKFTSNYHLFFMENITERRYKKPSHDNEIILASKISGLNNPLLSLLMNQIQPFSFYREILSIIDKNYINPISKRSTSKYIFSLQDTIFDFSDTIFVINFRPKSNAKFDALQGNFHINSNGWALQNVEAEPANDESNFSIKQSYNRPDSLHWFPNKLETKIGLTIGNSPIIGKNECYFSAVKINPILKNRDFSDALITIADDANLKTDKYWNHVRNDSLSQKEKNTYQLIDSIGRKHDFDKILNTGLILSKGLIPISFINLDINSIYDFNDMEGCRVGLGLYTNEKLAKYWSIGGYFAYGFKDKKYKFGGDLIARINLKKNFFIRLKFCQDVKESGSIDFNNFDANIFDINNLRHFLLTRGDYFQQFHLGVNFRLKKVFTIYPSFSQIFVKSGENVLYGTYHSNGFSGSNSFLASNFSLFIEANFKQNFIEYTNSKLAFSTKSLIPTIQFQIQKTIPNILGSKISAFSAKFAIFQILESRHAGLFSYKIQCGTTNDNIPLSFAFNAPASYRQFTIAATNSFETMRMNEFYSTNYIFVFLRRSFGNITFGKSKFAPNPELTTSIAWGNYSNKNHINVPEFKTLEHGFFESGLFLNNLLDLTFYNIGIGVVYRYGYYSLPSTKENFTYKISLKMLL